MSYNQVATTGPSLRIQRVPQAEALSRSQWKLPDQAQPLVKNVRREPAPAPAMDPLDQAKMEAPQQRNMAAVRDYSSGKYLTAQVEKLSGREATRLLLKNLLGVAAVLNRTLILPFDTCMCTGPLDQCGSWPVLPFGCPFRLPLDTINGCFSWCAALLERDLDALPRVVPSLTAGQLHNPKPDAGVSNSFIRVLLPEGLTDIELMRALDYYKDVRILELGAVEGNSNAARFCGWERSATDAKEQFDQQQIREDQFNQAVDPLLRMHNVKIDPILLGKCTRPQHLATRIPYV